jgi:hypothetical protein
MTGLQTGFVHPCHRGSGVGDGAAAQRRRHGPYDPGHGVAGHRHSGAPRPVVVAILLRHWEGAVEGPYNNATVDILCFHLFQSERGCKFHFAPLASLLVLGVSLECMQLLIQVANFTSHHN